ncbi:hypothetical protein D3C84_720590 [compost metagenome]
MITQRPGLQACVGLLPGARQQTGGRYAVEAPAQSQCCRPTHHLLHLECPQTLGALKGFDLGAFKDDFGTTAEVQQVAGVEIDKQQARPWIDQQVAQGIEEQIAGEVRDGQTITFHVYETGLTATVGNVH